MARAGKDSPDFMLAQPGNALGASVSEVVASLTASGVWAFEPKWDGIRAMARWDEGVRLISRRGLDISYRYPELIEAFSEIDLPAGTLIDGEVMVMSAGLPDFSLAHRRDAQQSPGKAAALAARHPATFAPFDVLQHGQEDARPWSYERRRTLLEDLFSGPLRGTRVMATPSQRDGVAMWQVVAEHRMEGLVAKRLASRYQGRRSPDWIKLRANRRLSALVCGIDPGKGERAGTFGALHLALIDKDTSEITTIGKVGTGFSDRELRALAKRLQSTDPVVVEVEYLEVSPNGQLRFPSYKGVRDDVEILSCSTSQLKE